MRFNQDAYDSFLVREKVAGPLPTPITLRSGGKSYWYANFRTLLNDVEKVDTAAQFVYDFVSDHDLVPTNFFAVPEGPREFASSANRILRASGKVVSAASLRAGYKTHGSPLDRYSVGPVSQNMRPVLIEDVTTTGNSSSEFVMLLQELGIPPLAVVSMLNRQERRIDGRTVKELFEGSYNVPYIPMTSASTILPMAVKLLQPDLSTLEGLRAELSDRTRYTEEIIV